MSLPSGAGVESNNELQMVNQSLGSLFPVFPFKITLNGNHTHVNKPKTSIDDKNEKNYVNIHIYSIRVVRA